MAYYVGDIPVEDIVIEPARNGLAIDLELFVEAETTVEWRDFEGTLDEEADFQASFNVDGSVVVAWPSASSAFPAVGIYSLTVVLHNGLQIERLAPLYVVAQPAWHYWHSVDSVRSDWLQAPEDDARLYSLLEVAKNDIEAYGTTIPAGPARQFAQRSAQAMQARNLWNAGTVDPTSGGEGDGSFTLKPFPLDWQIKQTLRPQRGIGAVA